jgi:hypothetical protein
MIPLSQCPGCQNEFFRTNHNSNWHEERCIKRCPLDYAQFHKTDFNDNEIGYFTFSTKDFNIYAYVDHFNIINHIYIYCKEFHKGSQQPALIFPLFDIDWSKMDFYNNKWKTWLVFS